MYVTPRCSVSFGHATCLKNNILAFSMVSITLSVYFVYTIEFVSSWESRESRESLESLVKGTDLDSNNVFVIIGSHDRIKSRTHACLHTTRRQAGSCSSVHEEITHRNKNISNHRSCTARAIVTACWNRLESSIAI
jgi:hypothetical protein